MIIRELLSSDIQVLHQIWKKHYSGEFTFPDFTEQFVQTFVVEDNDRIVTAGGIRLIAESVIVTNKDIPRKVRIDALQAMLQASLFTCARNGYDQLHAFVQDEKWQSVLEKYNFRPTKGEAMVIDVR